MKRKLNLERVYKISDYNTIRLGDEISELPDKVLMNPKAVEKVMELLQLNVEINYHKYLELCAKLSRYTEDIIMSELEALKAQTVDDLKTILDNLEGE